MTGVCRSLTDARFHALVATLDPVCVKGWACDTWINANAALFLPYQSGPLFRHVRSPVRIRGPGRGLGRDEIGLRQPAGRYCPRSQAGFAVAYGIAGRGSEACL